MNTEPRIFVTVERILNDAPVQVRREISLLEWCQSRCPGVIATVLIDRALEELSSK